MTILDAMLEAYTLATNKTSLPPTGSTKYNRLYSLCKKYHRDWCYEPGVDWASLYTVVSAGTVTATDTFDLDSDTPVIRLSQRPGDYILITTASNVFRYATKSPANLYQGRYDNIVSKIGQTIKFSRTFVSTDQMFGGAITVPVYAELEEISTVNDDVLIDNPAWLPVRVAAQYVLPDAQLNYLNPDLLAEANDLMQGMKLSNFSQEESYSTGENHFTVGITYTDEVDRESY